MAEPSTLAILAAAAAVVSAIASFLSARAAWRKHRLDLPALYHEWTTNNFEPYSSDVKGQYPRGKPSFFIVTLKLEGQDGYGISSIRTSGWYILLRWTTLGFLQMGTLWDRSEELVSNRTIVRPRRGKVSTKFHASTLPRVLTICVIGDMKRTRPRTLFARIQKSGFADIFYDAKVRMDQFSQSAKESA